MNNVRLTDLEKSLIFGNELEKMNDVLSIESALEEERDPISGEKERNNDGINAAKQKNIAQGKVNSALNQQLKAESNKNVSLSTKIAAKNNFQNAKLNQVNINKDAGLYEDAVDNLTASIARKAEQIDRAQEAKERLIANKEKEINTLRDQKEKLQNTKKVLTHLDDGNDTVTESLNKKVDKKPTEVVAKDIKNKDEVESNQVEATLTESKEINTVNYKKYSRMLFNGFSGEILKKLVNDETATDIKDGAVLNEVKKNKEAMYIAKKIRKYLKKEKEISYNDYIDLKVLKYKFKNLVGSVKKV